MKLKNGPNKSYFWPPKDDCAWNNDIITQIDIPALESSSSRRYRISQKDELHIRAIFEQ